MIGVKGFVPASMLEDYGRRVAESRACEWFNPNKFGISSETN